MKRLLILLILGILAAQENPPIPQLKVEEFTIVGIDTFKARRPIVDITPGFRSSIGIEDPDLIGFVSDKFPVKQFEITIHKPKEKTSFVRGSFGTGYGNSLHIKFLAGKITKNSLLLGNLNMGGAFGGDHGINAINGFISLSGKYSSGLDWQIKGGLLAKSEKASKGDTIITHKLASPTIYGKIARYPGVRGLFWSSTIDENFIINDSVNSSWLKLSAEAGYITEKPLKVYGGLKFGKLGDAGVTRAYIGFSALLGRLKLTLKGGLASTAGGKSSPVFDSRFAFPFANQFKLGLKVSKATEIANFGLYSMNTAFLSQIDKPYSEHTDASVFLHYSASSFSLQFGAGFRQYTSVPVLIKTNPHSWSFTSDTTSLKGLTLEFALYSLKHLSINGRMFLPSSEYSSDTLLLKGIAGISYVMPERGLLPEVRFSLNLANFNRRAVATEDVVFAKTIARHIGAFVELTNPFKEGFEIFVPRGYKINNGFSLALGLTMKF